MLSQDELERWMQLDRELSILESYRKHSKSIYEKLLSQ